MIPMEITARRDRGRNGHADTQAQVRVCPAEDDGQNGAQNHGYHRELGHDLVCRDVGLEFFLFHDTNSPLYIFCRIFCVRIWRTEPPIRQGEIIYNFARFVKSLRNLNRIYENLWESSRFLILQIPWVIVPIGQNAHQVRGLYTAMTKRPSSSDVSIKP